MERKEAIEIIVADEMKNISTEEREIIIYNNWGEDETNENFNLLPLDLKNEILKYDSPQEDILSSRYDMLVKIVCESSYSEYPNDKLADMVSKILSQTTIVRGKNFEKYYCPCCRQKTLSMRKEYDICPNCGWEDDGNENEDKYSSSNHMTLKEGRMNYLNYGKCSKKNNK